MDHWLLEKDGYSEVHERFCKIYHVLSEIIILLMSLKIPLKLPDILRVTFCLLVSLTKD